MRQFNFKQYKQLIENSMLKEVREQQEDEKRVIDSINDSKSRDAIDFGAGYGRLSKELSERFRSVYSIEINPRMSEELEKKIVRMDNQHLIKQDATSLISEIPYSELSKPVAFCMQNTLGTIEGNYLEFLRHMQSIHLFLKGDIVMTLFNAEKLNDFGRVFYSSLEPMVGKAVSFENGVFKSDTGYTSKWWTQDEALQIKSYFKDHELISRSFYHIIKPKIDV